MKCVTDNGICPPPNSSLSIEGDSWKHQRLAPGEGLCFSVFEKLRGAGCTQLGVHHQELGGLGLIWWKDSCQDAMDSLPTELNDSHFTKSCCLLQNSLVSDQKEHLEVELLST